MRERDDAGRVYKALEILRQEVREALDELGRRFAETRDPEVSKQIEDLSHQMGPSNALTSASPTFH